MLILALEVGSCTEADWPVLNERSGGQHPPWAPVRMHRAGLTESQAVAGSIYTQCREAQVGGTESAGALFHVLDQLHSAVPAGVQEP